MFLTASIPEAQIFIRDVGCDYIVVLWGAVSNAQTYRLIIQPTPGEDGILTFDPNDEREHRYENLASGTVYKLTLIGSGQPTELDVRTSMAIMSLCNAICIFMNVLNHPRSQYK